MEYIVGFVILFIVYKIIHSMLLSEKNVSKDVELKMSVKNAPYKLSKSNSSYSIDVNFDDDFGNFTLSEGFGHEEKSSNKSKGRWILPDECIKINGRNVTKGFIYFGGVLISANNNGRLESSLIDESRTTSDAKEIDNAEEIYTDESLGYWPSYATLSKECRGIFLDWLASNRSNPNMPVGYVFIYFYGFERRIVFDSKEDIVSDIEFVSIFKEVGRLNKIYGSNRSFKNYSNSLLELMSFLRPDVTGVKLFDLPTTSDQLSFKLALGRSVQELKPIHAELAFLWLKYSDGYSFKTPARRCDSEFLQLFKLRYQDKFKEGIKVKPNKTKLKLGYHSASASVGYMELDAGDLPDPSILSAPIKKLTPIADRCCEELDAYSRYLGRKGSSNNDVAALILLPDDLINESTSPVIKKFKQWANQIVIEYDGLATIEQLWDHVGTPLPATINKKESELLHLLAEKAGYGIAPDVRFHHAKMQPEGNVAIFAGGHGAYFEPSDDFYQIQMSLRLGAMVANADSNLHDAEHIVLKSLIDNNSKLSPVEKKSLHAYLTWQLNTQANMAGMKAKLDMLSSDEKDIVSRFIISVALADGKIDANEIKQIEKLYSSLGLNKSVVANDVHGLATESITSHKTQKLSVASNAQHSSNAIDAPKDAVFRLDMGVLALHEEETNHVKSILGNIFEDDDDDLLPEVNVSIDPSGLDKPHYSLYQKLVEKEQWAKDDFHKLCAELGLMVDGAIETINDWSFSGVDAPVLDDDGDIFVDFEIVEELKG
jgi:uncharacterized tellurite resistance protein B-like protein